MGNERGGRERNFVQKIIISSTKKLISRDKVHRWVDKNERKLNAKKTSRVIYRSDENWTSFSKSDFEEATAQFEGKEYMIPKGYDKILRASYGDYMKLPPEEKRISNHEVLNIDFGKYF